MNSDNIADLNEAGWQRVSPWAILHFLAMQLKHGINFAVYIIPAYIVGAHKILQSELLPLIIIGLIFSWVATAILRYYFFQFCITDRGVSIRSGLFDRTYTDLPFERIQHVKLDQPIYFRPKGLVIVTLDTAGSSKQEAQFAGVSQDYAQTLKRTIMARVAQLTEETELSKTTEAEVLNQRSMSDLVLHGITNNRVWILLGTLAPFYESISEFIFRNMNALRPQVEAWFGEQVVTMWYVGVMTVLVAFLLLMLMALFSIGGSIVMFYGYTLSKQDDKYIRKSGLLNRQEVSMKQSRVQIARQKQDWLDHLLKRVNLYFEQNVTGRANPNELKATHKLLVPSVTLTQATELTCDIFPGQDARSVSYQAVHQRYFWRLVLFIAFPLTVIIALILFATMQATGLFFTLPVFAVLTFGAYLRWKRWGIALDQQYIYVRKGLVGVDYWCFPHTKLQQMVVKQSFLMRKRNVVTLRFVLASGGVSIPFVEGDYAMPLVDRLLTEIEFNKPKWM